MMEGDPILRPVRRAGWDIVIADTLVAASLTTGFVLMFFYIRGFATDMLPTAILALFFCLAISLLFRHWLIIPGLALLALIILAFLYWQADWWDDWIYFLRVYFEWAANRLLLGGPEPPFPIWIDWLKLLLVLAFSLPVMAVVRLIGRILAMLVPALLTVIPFLIYFPDQIALILPILGGLIVYLPASMIQTVQAAQPNARLPRAPLQFLAVPVAIITLLAGQYITPIDTSNWRQQDWLNRIGDWSDLWMNQNGTGRSWQPFNISFAGFKSADQQLGGPVILNEQTYLEVAASEPFLLRSVTRTLYTGNSWQSPVSQVYRYDSPLWWLVSRQVFVNDLPSGEDGEAFRRQFYPLQSVTIKPRIPRISSLFSVGHIQRFDWYREKDPLLYFTQDSDLFTLDFAAGSKTYTMITQVANRRHPEFTAAMRRLEKAVDERNKDPYWTAIQERYLQLPENLPPEVADTAQEIMSEGNGLYDQAVRLEVYLRDNFEYTLEPEPAPLDGDFVAHVLASQEGYCVHFATAMVVMARTAGIPARYVEGFALEEGVNSTTWLATGKTAHAWAELYFRGIGWLTFDATPPDRTVPVDEPVDPGLPPATPMPSPSPSPQPTPGMPGVEPAKPSPWPIILLTTSLILLAVLLPLLLLLLKRRHVRRITPDNMRLRWTDRTECMEQTYHDILHQLSCMKVQPESGETLSAFADRAEHYLRFGSLKLDDVVWPVIRWRYGEHRPSEDDLEQILDLHLRLEGRLRESLTRPAWFFRRVLHRFPKSDNRSVF